MWDPRFYHRMGQQNTRGRPDAVFDQNTPQRDLLRSQKKHRNIQFGKDCGCNVSAILWGVNVAKAKRGLYCLTYFFEGVIIVYG
jgi:hypothetical protein